MIFNLKGLNTPSEALAICEKRALITIQEDYNKALAKIKQLKEDKSRLQEALRKVMSERNSKTEKLKTLREKYLSLKTRLSSDPKLSQKPNNQCLESTITKPSKDKGANMLKIFDSISEFIKNNSLILFFNEEYNKLIKKNLAEENWEKACSVMLSYHHEVMKKNFEFTEQDTPEFRNQSPDKNYEKIIINSNYLIQNLTQQQEKLESIEKVVNTNTPKHRFKTCSVVLNPIRTGNGSSSALNSRRSEPGNSWFDAELKNKIYSNEYISPSRASNRENAEPYNNS